MKKIISLLLVFCLLLVSLSGCVNTIDNSADSTSDPDSLPTNPTDITEPSGESTGTEPADSPTEPSDESSTGPSVESTTDSSDAPSTEATVIPTEPTEAPTTTPPTEEPTTMPPTQATTAPPATEPTQQTKPTNPSNPSGESGRLQGIYSRNELNAMDTKVNGWGLGPYTDDDNRPYDAIRAQDKYGKYEAYYIAPNDGKIYLTFDEGYENGYTGKILDVLKEKNVKAVFFITMQYAKDSPELVQRMIDEGHVVGNHSVRHKSMPTLSLDKMIDEVVGLHDYVLDKFGYEMTLFRPPMGEYSQQSLAVLQELGYKSVMWSFAYYDYDPANQMAHDKAYNKIVSAAHGGAIYLLHAVSATNTAVLGDVIDTFRSNGYELALFQ